MLARVGPLHHPLLQARRGAWGMGLSQSVCGFEWRHAPTLPACTVCCRQDRQAALQNAQDSGQWQPEWQLELGAGDVPAGLSGLRHALHRLLHLVWAALALATCSVGGDSSEGSSAAAAEDCGSAACRLLALALRRKRDDFAELLWLQQGSTAGGAEPTAPPLLPEGWRTPASFLARLEWHLLGSGGGGDGSEQRPGILFLLRSLAGSPGWGEGEDWPQRRQQAASWELQGCARAVASQAEELLREVQGHVRGAAPGSGSGAEAWPAAVAPTGEGTMGDQEMQQQQQVAKAAAAVVGTSGDHDMQQQQLVAAEEEQQRGKLQRQQRALARMRAQQSRAAATLLPPEAGGPAEKVGAEGPEQVAAAQPLPLQQQPQSAGVDLLPPHHPAAWERQQGSAACSLCHQHGSAAAPLGLVAQLQVTVLPLLAAADSAPAPSPHTLQQPGMPAAAVAAAASPGPAATATSVFDRQPSLHMLCCGHLLHAPCLESYRCWWCDGVQRAVCLQVWGSACVPSLRPLNHAVVVMLLLLLLLLQGQLAPAHRGRPVCRGLQPAAAVDGSRCAGGCKGSACCLPISVPHLLLLTRLSADLACCVVCRRVPVSHLPPPGELLAAAGRPSGAICSGSGGGRGACGGTAGGCGGTAAAGGSGGRQLGDGACHLRRGPRATVGCRRGRRRRWGGGSALRCAGAGGGCAVPVCAAAGGAVDVGAAARAGVAAGRPPPG